MAFRSQVAEGCRAEVTTENARGDEQTDSFMENAAGGVAPNHQHDQVPHRRFHASRSQRRYTGWRKVGWHATTSRTRSILREDVGKTNIN